MMGVDLGKMLARTCCGYLGERTTSLVEEGEVVVEWGMLRACEVVRHRVVNRTVVRHVWGVWLRSPGWGRTSQLERTKPREWIRTSLHQVLTWRSRTSENSSLVARTVRIETFDPEIRIAYVGGDCGFGSHCTVGGMRNREILGSEQNESGSSRASFRLPSTASETERGGAVRCVIVGRFHPFSSLPSMTFQLARRSQKVDLVVARAG